jgi:uncharacterized protein
VRGGIPSQLFLIAVNFVGSYNMLIETKNSKYWVLEELGILVNEELKEEFSHLAPKPLKKEEAIDLFKEEISDSQIMERISQCNSIALVTTESCNFRCKYCVYSGKYINERTHSDQKMNIETAKKAVDLIFNLATGKHRKKLVKTLVITFYGGESLLEFQLVKNTIEYAETEALKRDLNKQFEIRFRLSTNGYLLRDHVVDFLKEKDVYLDVSLDGPAEQHDRFRVTREGKSTWNTIIANLKILKQKYPDYYQRRVNYLATIHPLHNSGEIDSFFTQTPELFLDKLPRINLVSTRNLIQDEAESFEKIKIEPSKLFVERIFQELVAKFKLQSRGKGLDLTGTCFPGAEKILVNSDGSLGVCEKISPFAPKLGHVDKGFDFDSIRHLLREYSAAVVDTQCWNCPVWFLCETCIANAFDGSQFRIDCSVKETYSRIIKDYIEEKEAKENREYSTNSNSVIDFIEQL